MQQTKTILPFGKMHQDKVEEYNSNNFNDEENRNNSANTRSDNNILSK